MKKILFAIGLGLLGGCTSPKYTASFSYRDANPGYTSSTRNALEERSVTKIDSRQLLAGASRGLVVTSELAAVIPEVKKTYSQMSIQERKVLRQQLKKEIKNFVQPNKKQVKVNATHASGMDKDLKLAAIFGAIGFVLLFFSGILGAIALIIGVVFFVKWLVRQ